MTEANEPVGLIAGAGAVPRQVAETLRARGTKVHIITIDGEGAERFEDFPVTRVNWGEIGRIIATLRQAGCTSLVIVGRVQRPRLHKVRPDFGLFAGIASVVGILTSGGDDAVLSGVVRFFERKGLRIRSVGEVVPELLVGEGQLAREIASPDDRADVVRGLDLLAAIGRFDIGQGVVVSNGMIEAIEGAEGTDRMLERVEALRREATCDLPDRAGVLIKCPKPGQDMRVDLPAIGPETVRRAAAAGLSGISVAAGYVLGAERSDLIARADETATFVEGVPFDIAQRGGAAKRRSTAGFTLASSRKIAARHNVDCQLGLAVSSALRTFGAGRHVISVRGRVMAVGAAEKVCEVVGRFGDYRARSGRIMLRRSGILTVHDMADVDEALISLVADAKMSGICALSRITNAPGFSSDVITAADKGAIILVSAKPNEGSDA